MSKFVNSKHVWVLDPHGRNMLSPDGFYLALNKETNSLDEIELKGFVIDTDGQENKYDENQDENVKQNNADKVPSIVGEGSSKGEVKKWPDEMAVTLLLEKWKKHEKDFKQGLLRHEVIWRKISEELLTEGGYNYTGSQCQNKFKDLHRNYTKVTDHNNRTGVEPKTCKHYEKMDALFSEKPIVKPVSLASNRRKPVINNNSDSEEGSSANESAESSDKAKKNLKRKRKQTKVQKQMKEWTDILLQESTNKREDQNRRHEENQSLLKQMLDSNNTFFSKLLEKL